MNLNERDEQVRSLERKYRRLKAQSTAAEPQQGKAGLLAQLTCSVLIGADRLLCARGFSRANTVKRKQSHGSGGGSIRPWHDWRRICVHACDSWRPRWRPRSRKLRCLWCDSVSVLTGQLLVRSDAPGELSFRRTWSYSACDLMHVPRVGRLPLCYFEVRLREPPHTFDQTGEPPSPHLFCWRSMRC